MAGAEAARSFHGRTPPASSPAVRATMLANRGRDTAPERVLRMALKGAGFRFLEHAAPAPGIRCTADVVFRKARTCIFVDGCYWHGCPRHFTTPKRNGEWWTEKIARTKARDARQRAALRAASWKVIRLWEHQLGGAAAKTVGRLIVRLERRMLERRRVRRATQGLDGRSRRSETGAVPQRGRAGATRTNVTRSR